MADVVTVAIPVRNGGEDLARVLDALDAQEVDREVELLVCDSGSTDGSADLARSHGATVIAIDPAGFSHGGTRNLLAERARGDHVAFLTQDAVPARPDWLARLLAAFELADDVGLAFGPYLPRADASAPVARELTEWFGSFTTNGSPRIDRLEPEERALPETALMGPRAFFTDANGAIARSAWSRVPFRAVPYAEDHRLAIDMLRAGFAKAFVPDAAVVHSHDYGPWDLLRRSFDEWRALREVYGFTEPLGRAGLRRNVVGPVRADARWRRSHPGAGSPAGSVAHHLLRYGGAVLGARADRLPRAVRRLLSLEGRATFEPSHAS